MVSHVFGVGAQSQEMVESHVQNVEMLKRVMTAHFGEDKAKDIENMLSSMNYVYIDRISREQQEHIFDMALRRYLGGKLRVISDEDIELMRQEDYNLFEDPDQSLITSEFCNRYFMAKFPMLFATKGLAINTDLIYADVLQDLGIKDHTYKDYGSRAAAFENYSHVVKPKKGESAYVKAREDFVELARTFGDIRGLMQNAIIQRTFNPSLKEFVSRLDGTRNDYSPTNIEILRTLCNDKSGAGEYICRVNPLSGRRTDIVLLPNDQNRGLLRLFVLALGTSVEKKDDQFVAKRGFYLDSKNNDSILNDCYAMWHARQLEDQIFEQGLSPMGEINGPVGAKYIGLEVLDNFFNANRITFDQAFFGGSMDALKDMWPEENTFALRRELEDALGTLVRRIERDELTADEVAYAILKGTGNNGLFIPSGKFNVFKCENAIAAVKQLNAFVKEHEGAAENAKPIKK